MPWATKVPPASSFRATAMQLETVVGSLAGSSLVQNWCTRCSATGRMELAIVVAKLIRALSELTPSEVISFGTGRTSSA